MDERIVERGEDVCDAKDEFTLSNLRTKTYNFFLLNNLLFGRLFANEVSIHSGHEDVGKEPYHYGI